MTTDRKTPVAVPDSERVCGHRYTNASGVEFWCSIAPHPRKPNNHFFEQDPNKVSSQRLEASLEDHFRKLVFRSRGATFKLVSTSAGMPDRLVLINGKIYLVELKAHGGELRPDQKVWHTKAKNTADVDVITLTGRGEVNDWVASVAPKGVRVR